MRFRVVHSEPRRVLLSHEDESVKATLEITDHDGASLAEFFPEGKFLEVEINDALEQTVEDRDQLAAEASTLTVEERMALHHADGARIEVTINQSIHDADDPDRVYAATKKAIAELLPPGGTPAPSTPVALDAVSASLAVPGAPSPHDTDVPPDRE